MECQITYDGDTIDIENVQELFIAFDLTPPEVDLDFISQIKHCLNDIIKNDDDFLFILPKVLGIKGQSKKPLLEAFGENLSNIITEGKTLSRALAILANEKDQEYLLKTLGRDNLQKILDTLEEIAGCLEWLYGKMDKYFLEIISFEHLAKFLNNGENLGIILKYLDEAEEKLLIENLGWDKVLNCIQTTRDLTYVLTGLRTSNERMLIEKMDKEKLHQVIPFEEKLANICKNELQPEDAKLLMSKY